MPELTPGTVLHVDDDGHLRDRTGTLVRPAALLCRRLCVSAGLYVASIIIAIVAGFIFARVCDALAWNFGGWL